MVTATCMLALCPGSKAACLAACLRQVAHDLQDTSAASRSFLTHVHVLQQHLTNLRQAHPSAELHVCRRWQREGPQNRADRTDGQAEPHHHLLPLCTHHQLLGSTGSPAAPARPGQQASLPAMLQGFAGV